MRNTLTTMPSDARSSSPIPTHPQLRMGIPLLLGPGVTADPDRALLSTGISSASGRVLGGRAYCTPAFVPKLPWVRPSADSLRLLSPDTARPRMSVTIVRISAESLNALHELGVGAEPNPLAHQKLLLSGAVTEAVKACLADLADYISDVAGLTVLGFTVGEPGIPTVALNPNLRAGLHVDDWDKAQDRATSRNRLHLNLGREPRHFLYVNLPIDEARALAPPGINDTLDRGNIIGNSFMEANPDYPVVRVRVDPGEAYIAPTDYLIHDGDTTDKLLPDVTFAMLGNFGAPTATQPWRANEGPFIRTRV